MIDGVLENYGEMEISLEALRIYAERVFGRNMKIVREDETGYRIIIPTSYLHDTFESSGYGIYSPTGEIVTRNVVAFCSRFGNDTRNGNYTIKEMWHHDEPLRNYRSTTKEDLEAVIEIEQSL